MKNYKILAILLVTLAVFSNCSNHEPEPSILTGISGLSQKGPFILGSSVIIRELTEELNQTGRNFSTQIISDCGAFDIQNVELTSQYIEIAVDGFYFNEILGQNSISKIELLAITKISDRQNINVNILTHLEKGRVEQLFSEGFEFEDAKKQAQNELFQIFEMNSEILESSEDLDLMINSQLLAISSIIQGYRLEADMIELINKMSIDLADNGILDDTSLGSGLLNHAKYLDSEEIKNNLENKCSNEVSSPKEVIDNFIALTAFPFTNSIINYPATGSHGKNLLSLNESIYFTNGSSEVYSLRADLPSKTSLEIRIKNSDGSEADWSYNFTTINGWNQQWDPTRFIALGGSINDVELRLPVGSFIMEYYEMDSEEPTIVKNFVVQN